jgi:hypothetical protein
MVTGKQEREFLPGLRVEPVEPSSATTSVTLPGATTAFAAADIYAGATGYIVSRNAKAHLRSWAQGDFRPGVTIFTHTVGDPHSSRKRKERR